MYKKTKLKNGIRVVKAQNKNIETVTLLALFGTGSREEKGKAEGVAHFLEHMFFKGTEKRPHCIEINKELDAVGASSNAFTGKEYTGFWIKSGKKDLEMGLDILSDMLLHSLFSPKEIENEKGPVLEEINMYADTPMRDISSVFEQLLFDGHGLGHDQLGAVANVKSFSRKDLVSFYKKHYRADNLVLAVSGNFDEDTIDKEIKKFFSSFDGAKTKTKQTKFSTWQEKPEILLKYKKTDQTNFSLGFRAFATGHKDEYILDVLNIILGGNSSSRLFEAVREREGLAYYVYSYSCDYRDTGYFTVQSGVGNDKCEKAIALVLKEIHKLKEQGVSKEELQRAKSYVEGKMAISLESSSAVADFVAIQEITTGKILTPEEKFDKINAVTREDVSRVAQEIFTKDRMNLALIGPFKSKKKFDKLLKI
ncbi:MAG: pitrilysin family protein [Candidatus Pacebacteria bacterium]|nr:pitrilysin family protein [Candidatus Paceibacterota bacterium]